jgi:hypothetical protein
MVPVSLDCLCSIHDDEKQNKDNLEKLEPLGTQDEDKQNKDNLEKLAPLGTQET